MIAAALLLAASSWSLEFWVEIPPTPETSAAPADPEEVVVNGVRVRRLKMSVKTDRKTGVAKCTLKRASGDPRLDAMVCAEAIACNVPPIRSKTLEACMMPRIERVVSARYPDRTVSPPTRSNQPD